MLTSLPSFLLYGDISSLDDQYDVFLHDLAVQTYLLIFGEELKKRRGFDEKKKRKKEKSRKRKRKRGEREGAKK